MNTHPRCFTPSLTVLIYTKETNFQLVKIKGSVETVISAFESVTCKAKASRKEKRRPREVAYVLPHETVHVFY